MTQIAVEKLTLEKFLKLPETKPASQYIDGLSKNQCLEENTA